MYFTSLNKYGKLRVVNTSYRILHTECNGCDFCEVLSCKRNRIMTEKYFCDAKNSYINPKTVIDCEYCEKLFRR